MAKERYTDGSCSHLPELRWLVSSTRIGHARASIKCPAHPRNLPCRCPALLLSKYLPHNAEELLALVMTTLPCRVALLPEVIEPILGIFRRARDTALFLYPEPESLGPHTMGSGLRLHSYCCSFSHLHYLRGTEKKKQIRKLSAIVDYLPVSRPARGKMPVLVGSIYKISASACALLYRVS